MVCTVVAEEILENVRAGGSRSVGITQYVKNMVETQSVVDGGRAVSKASATTGDRFVAPEMLAATRPAPAGSFRLKSLPETRGVYNARKVSAAVLRSMLPTVNCSPAFASFKLVGKNSIQIRKELNARLAKGLAEGTHDAAFAKLYEFDDRPRADDIEAMVASYPAWHSIDWDEPSVTSGLDIGLWQA